MVSPTCTPSVHHLDPDCAAGKHAICRGEGWCNALDRAVACGCSCHRSSHG